jgi:hypothetical protein
MVQESLEALRISIAVAMQALGMSRNREARPLVGVQIDSLTIEGKACLQLVDVI